LRQRFVLIALVKISAGIIEKDLNQSIIKLVV